MTNINIQKKTTLSSSISLQHEPLFLNPDGVRVRYPIGWNGYGRYVKGSLRVLNNTTGKQEEITEEDNGVFFSFKNVPSKGSYEDYTVFYNVREDDYKFSTGASGSTYEGEEYFLFPNWLEAIGEKEAFWIGKYQASLENSILYSKKETYSGDSSTSFSTFKTLATNKGTGFHVLRNREWSNIALWCKYHNIKVEGCIYGRYGNNGSNYFAHNVFPEIYNTTNHLKNGYQPISYSHNHKKNGIYDLVGNYWEMVDGIKKIGAKIYVFDKNNEYIDTGFTLNDSNSAANFSSSNSFTAFNYLSNKVTTDGIDLSLECIPSNLTDSISLGIEYRSGLLVKDMGSENVFTRGGNNYDGPYTNLFVVGLHHTLSTSDEANTVRLVKEL